MKTYPVSVITGFLGAGKTTFLNRMLKDAALARSGVIINEFGDIGLDHLLVEKADENIIEMSSGCLCCSIRGDLSDTILDLIAQRGSDFDRLIIETTGLADPAPILQTLMSHPELEKRVRLAEVITLVDGLHGFATLEAQPEAMKQIAVADRILLSKQDMLSAPATDLLKEIARLQPAAQILDAQKAEAQEVFGFSLYDVTEKPEAVRAWLSSHDHEHHHDQHRHHHDDVNRHGKDIIAFSARTDVAMRPQSLAMFLELLSSYHGARILRLKGIVKLQDDPERPVIIHGVQHVIHAPQRLKNWPDADHSSRLVVMTRGIEKQEIQGLLDAFTDPLTGEGVSQMDDTLKI
jgi:G3E family GTPase